MAGAATLLEQALTLPTEAREDLALQILLSVEEDRHPPMSQEAFETMIKERIEKLERGEMETRDAFEVIAEIRERLRSRRQ